MFDPIILPAPPQSIKLQPVPVPEPPSLPVKKKPIIDEPEVILISGLTYPRERGQKIRADVFGRYCQRMAVRLNGKYPGIMINLFNFHDGELQLCEFDGSLLKKMTSVKSYGKLDIRNYRYLDLKDYTIKIQKPQFDDPSITQREKELYYFPGIADAFGSLNVSATDYGRAVNKGKIKEKSISIRDVYAYIEGIGQHKPGNLKELHFFSRGDSLFATPELTGDYLISYPVQKDPNTFDFDEDPVSPIKDFPNFKAAFAKESTIVFWGSFLNREAQEMISRTVHSRAYQQALADPEKTTVFTSEYGSEWTLQRVMEFVHDSYIAPSYPHRLGEAIVETGRKQAIFMAPPGTDATTDDEIKQKRCGDSLMHIFMGKDFEDPPQQDFREILKFYDEAMGMKFLEPKEKYHKVYGRGYIKIY